MVTIQELALSRHIGLKISGLLMAIDTAPFDAYGFKERLNQELAQLHEELITMLPACQEDRILNALITAPATGLFLNANRESITLEDLIGWILIMDDPLLESKDRVIAKLRLLFYFGTSAAMDRFLELHSKSGS